MNDDEVNKIIAEFMGTALVKRGYYWFLKDVMGELYSTYTKSLDALVPVWEKLEENRKTCFEGILLGYCFGKKDLHTASFFDYGYEGIETFHGAGGFNTIHQAAAHATAKAILELKDE